MKPKPKKTVAPFPLANKALLNVKPTTKQLKLEESVVSKGKRKAIVLSKDDTTGLEIINKPVAKAVGMRVVHREPATPTGWFTGGTAARQHQAAADFVEDNLGTIKKSEQLVDSHYKASKASSNLMNERFCVEDLTCRNNKLCHVHSQEFHKITNWHNWTEMHNLQV
ncbi:hypothetical protein FRC09_002770 [Ceratobasidium sp. 395]|nr:hypothetical protein FRC09_002770 [Ceratobasidium sp. 395]